MQHKIIAVITKNQPNILKMLGNFETPEAKIIATPIIALIKSSA
jgi:hypothetical protein